MSQLTARLAQQKIRALGSPERAALAVRFFKTGKGEYGEGDQFVGVRVPVLRTVAKEFRTLPAAEVQKLLRSPIHEERLVALLIWTLQVRRVSDDIRRDIYERYLANTAYINNWDLVDSSAPQLVGEYLLDKSRQPLYRLARSKNLWERRIGILATFPFLRADDFGDTLAIAELLVQDNHDLIHKAVGWLLREVGKRNSAVEESFLDQHAPLMPRTMLRYAIERFPEKKKRKYMTM